MRSEIMSRGFVNLAKLMLQWVVAVDFTEPHANFDAEVEYLEDQIWEEIRAMVKRGGEE
jgi:hypothetical protein